jgi:hypothetical protein
MPRLPINYSKTIIYKIVCNDLNINDIYVGHTTDFIRRKSEHIRHSNYEYKQHLTLYKTIIENGGWGNFSMIEIEKYPCNDSNEARARERYYIELLNCTLNNIIPTRTPKEYRMTNKKIIDEYHKNYRTTNKELINEKSRQYRKDNKEYYKEYDKKRYEIKKNKI